MPYICIRKCYYPFNKAGDKKLYEPGDPLEGDVEPGKHFAMNGVPVEVKPVYSQGDDPRSTKQIIADLKDKFGIDAKGKSRKKAFALWREAAAKAEDAARQDVQASGAWIEPTEDGTPVAPGSYGEPEFENPILRKRFSEMSPDDIDKITAKEICQKLSAAPYSLQDVRHTGITKAALVEKGLAIEENVYMNMG